MCAEQQGREAWQGVFLGMGFCSGWTQVWLGTDDGGSFGEADCLVPGLDKNWEEDPSIGGFSGILLSAKRSPGQRGGC